MKEVVGSIIDLGLNGELDVLIHTCNCQNTFGSELSKQIKERIPGVYELDKKTIKGDRSKLGTFQEYIHMTEDRHKLIIVNAYTQFYYGGDVRCVSYSAMQKIFIALARRYRTRRLRIGYPKIGVGYGGGDWDIISSNINKIFKDLDHTFVIHPDAKYR